MRIGDASVTEGNAGTQNLTFTLTRAAGSTGAVTVDYALSLTAGSGRASADDLAPGTPLTGTVSFADGQTSRTIVIGVAGDAVGEPTEIFEVLLSNATGGLVITDGSGTGAIVNDDMLVVTIPMIQGNTHRSVFEGQSVTVGGVVTAVDSNGFYLQDAAGDGNDSTSDAIFVFTASAPTVVVGNTATVTGTVAEFLPGNDPGNLTVTQLSTPTVSVTGTAALPAPVIIGPDGRRPPTEILDDDDFAVFDIVNDGLNFYESLEGMLVTARSPVTVAPTDSGSLYTVATANGADQVATNLSPEGTVVVSGGAGGLGVTNQGPGSDFNPERVQIRVDTGILPGGSIPNVSTGTRLNDVTGVIDYSFGFYNIEATAQPTIAASSTLLRGATTFGGDPGKLTVASFNVENLDPTDPAAKFTDIARDIVTALGAPDIVGLQEIQDNDGAANTDVVSASLTLSMLSDAIFSESGIRYSVIDNTFITDDNNGGEPGGNIRVAFLYRADRVSLLSTGTIDPAGPDAFDGARKPLVATFSFGADRVTLVNNHFTSKGGSGQLGGSDLPSLNAAEDRRAQQADLVNGFVDGLLATNVNANMVVLGDLNDFQFEEPLGVLEGTLTYSAGTVTPGGARVLTNLTNSLAPEDRYSFIFEGNSQALDHILVSRGLLTGARYEGIHINAPFTTKTSDHDPRIAELSFFAPNQNVTLVGSDGFNVLDGDGGDDFLFGQGGNDQLNGEGGNDVLLGEDGNDTLNGGDGNDILQGNDGNDALDGGAGNDNLDGGAGTNTLNGGAGNDSIVGGDEIDTINGGQGDDIVLGNGGNDVLNGEDGGDALIGGAGNDTIVGGAGDDGLQGNDGNDALDGGAGSDVFQGGAGDDLYVVEIYGETVIEAAGEGTDSILTVAPIYQLDANFENLTYNLVAGSAAVAVTYVGNAAANALSATLAASAVLSGLEGNDILDGSGGDDALFGGADNDALSGLGGNDLLLGEEGDDLLIGGDGNDILQGNAGNDTLDGGAGDDRLFDGLGVDLLTLGLGVDEVRFTSIANANGDTIADFLSGTDKISFDLFDANDLVGGTQEFSFIAGATFNGTGQASAGQLRFANGLLQGDTNGDGVADFTITVIGDPVVLGDLLL